MENRLFKLAILIHFLWATGCACTYSNLGPEHTVHLDPPNTNIDEQPSDADLHIKRVRLLPVPAECAYAIVADIADWADWDPSIKEARLVRGTRTDVGTVFFQDLGEFQANAEIVEAHPGKRLRWRGQNPDGSGPVGIHTWTFVAQPDGTTLVLNDEHFHTWYLRPLGWFTDAGIADQFDATLAALEQAALERCD